MNAQKSEGDIWNYGQSCTVFSQFKTLTRVNLAIKLLPDQKYGSHANHLVYGFVASLYQLLLLGPYVSLGLYQSMPLCQVRMLLACFTDASHKNIESVTFTSQIFSP